MRESGNRDISMRQEWHNQINALLFRQNEPNPSNVVPIVLQNEASSGIYQPF